MKASNNKTVLISIITLLILAMCFSYIYYLSLDVYIEDSYSGLIYKDGVVYHYDGTVTSSYESGELKADGIIGRVEGVGFIRTFLVGPKVIKLKGHSESEIILVRGLMRQDVFKR